MIIIKFQWVQYSDALVISECYNKQHINTTTRNRLQQYTVERNKMRNRTWRRERKRRKGRRMSKLKRKEKIWKRRSRRKMRRKMRGMKRRRRNRKQVEEEKKKWGGGRGHLTSSACVTSCVSGEQFPVAARMEFLSDGRREKLRQDLHVREFYCLDSSTTTGQPRRRGRGRGSRNWQATVRRQN